MVNSILANLQVFQQKKIVLHTHTELAERDQLEKALSVSTQVFEITGRVGEEPERAGPYGMKFIH